MFWLLLILFLGFASCENDYCEGNTTCPTSETVPSRILTEKDELPTTSTVSSTERVTVELMMEQPTSPQLQKPTQAPTIPTPTSPPFTKKFSNAIICWCDVTVNTCDVNCCCDKDCSPIQQQVFTHCSDLKSLFDLKSCYASDLFFRKPKSIETIEENGLLCVVRENLAMSKEFKPRLPIQSVEEFDKELRRQRLVAFPEREPRYIFSENAYRMGTVIWTFRRGNLIPLSILQHLSGNLCLSTRTVTFLDEIQTSCSVPPIVSPANCSKWVLNTLLDIVEGKIITAPQNINMSDIEGSLKNCSSSNSCSSPNIFMCKEYPSSKNCVSINATVLSRSKECSFKGAAMELSFRHNASQGISLINARIWILNNPVLETKVKFLWLNSSETPFTRSGNPGYLNHRPILAGKKVSLSFNDTAKLTREAINMTISPEGWLTTLSGAKEYCSGNDRVPVLFNNNFRTSCSLKLQRKYFEKNGCIDFQTTIFDFLLGENVLNMTSKEVNRYVGCFGNSNVENMGDWIEIIVDSFPLLSTQASFEKSIDGLWCKNIVSSLYIDIAFSKFGSFAAPQSKIIGVLFRFGNARHVFARCYSGGCENRASGDSIRLTTLVKFIDFTSPPVREFAHPPGLEAKLPHDFFYPFFSGRGNVTMPPKFLIILFVALSILKLPSKCPNSS